MDGVDKCFCMNINISFHCYCGEWPKYVNKCVVLSIYFVFMSKNNNNNSNNNNKGSSKFLARFSFILLVVP